MQMWMTLILALQLLSALTMIGLVLVQHGKGADMGASFGSGASGSLFGATGSANFLSRSTAVMATVFFLCTLALAYVGGVGNVRERGACLRGDDLVGLGVIGAPFAVPDDGVAATALVQHAGRHLAGVGTLVVGRHVLRAPTDVAAGQLRRRLAEVDEGHAHRDIGDEGPRRDQRGQQFGVGRPVAVHLPVADHELASHLRSAPFTR